MAQGFAGQANRGAKQPGKEHQEEERRAADQFASFGAAENAIEEHFQRVADLGAVGGVNKDKGHEDQQVGHKGARQPGWRVDHFAYTTGNGRRHHRLAVALLAFGLFDLFHFWHHLDFDFFFFLFGAPHREQLCG